ncbi:MFS transporter [Nocardia sp. CNY236]|uniref:MFS transporter n=1 Tax=Nocardia sp. CNY236 TaxID=1169152 RepID=UPI00042033C2|nr:MFS transporter [Nocardia sp. CNY236]
MIGDARAATRRHAEVTLLLFASTLGVMAGAIVMPVLEVIRGDLGISSTAAGFIITTHGLAIAAVSPLIGRAIDRWGVRTPLAAGLVLYGVGGGAGVFITSFPLLIASRALLGIGAAAVFSGTTVAILAMADGARRDRLMGWRTTATTAGGLVWPALAGVLGEIGWHATFAIYCVGIPLGIATMLLIPERTSSEQGSGARHRGSAWDLLRRHRILVAWYGLMITTGLMMYSLAVFLPTRLAQLGIDKPIFVSLFMVVQASASILVGLGYARIRARFGFTALLRTTAGCWTAAFTILGLADHPVPVFLASALFGLGNGLLLPVITVLIGETPPSSQRGLATSLSGTAMFFGQFVSPLVFGPVMEATSITGGYFIAAALAAVILVALLSTRVADPTESREESTSTAAQDRTDLPAERTVS